MTSAFAQLPAAVSTDIFWLTPFLDTLRCEQVCRSWQTVLNRSSAPSEDLFTTWSPGIWGNELELLVVKAEKEREKPALNRRSIAITLPVSRRDSTFFGEMFFKWLTDHAAGFLRTHVHKTDPQSSWLFARTVLAIGIASLSAPPLFTISFDAGEVYFA